ncbi:MAG: hypothetical protein WBC37_11605 [Burkholderiaceae bacterium]
MTNHHGARRVILPMALSGAIALAGCGVYILEPPRPSLMPEESAPANASELVVVVNGGRGLAGWTVAVEGKPRAWIPGYQGYTRIAVAGGSHVVRVTNKVREFDIVFVPLPPITTSEEVDATVDCPAAGRCAVAVRAVLQPAEGWRPARSRLESTPIPASDIDAAVAKLEFTAPGG